MKIYYVEDEKDLAEIIRKYLVREGYETTVFHDGETALEHVQDPVDMWILDIMLTGEVSGYDLIKAIKENHSTASVIFTSARDQDLDKIMGLELGSDDYLAKPYSPRELILRVKAVLKRQLIPQVSEIVRYGEYEINITKREIRLESEMIDLTNKEFELLLFFIKNINQAFAREDILKHVWGENYYGSDRVVDDLLRRLRHKMPELKIETIYGYGYRLL
ncbi:MAG: DNA-binding response regulator [Tenericutes bacterium GWC2_34_14]|nr:MAG: DNA-binding response regulator [Tenericutes bacterium GWA2_35_7]OHE28063.1 MAG: DNA-binding response regulator [Tenericutes bacterium GWC2_34_14]OHE32996.1 MAG: DNA-binding response regulator [Tenericutes bacterium GWE2_34_108]OHE36038.1 MAG: DNA-binding response regulator [Tenericutes bacterium GWF1_35_14]OHE39261.1 MAG: DNA-binding response regulator [Tenericutes bacterium GWF2_35_184]OHE44536.1 MAG: DNA-binding response regulator [Tenericutes bacterium RIFOXYA2_FULL_36_32]OHE46951.